MFAVDSTPVRAAPTLHVDAATIEKNTSPAVSEGASSSHPLTTASSSSSSKPRSASTATPQPSQQRSRATFPRTNHAAASVVSIIPPRAADTPPRRSTASLAVPATPHDAAVPPSPVRSILHFYLGVSPSPRRPREAPQKSAAAASPTSPTVASTKVVEEKMEDDGNFHRSPAPPRTYMEAFLAAEEDDQDAYLIHDAPTRHALDNSPIVQEMWDETSSSAESSGASSDLSTATAQTVDTQVPLRTYGSAGGSEAKAPAPSLAPAGTARTAARGSTRERLPRVERELFHASPTTEKDSAASRATPSWKHILSDTAPSEPWADETEVDEYDTISQRVSRPSSVAPQPSADAVVRLLASVAPPRTGKVVRATPPASTGETSLSRLLELHTGSTAARRPSPGCSPQRLAPVAAPAMAEEMESSIQDKYLHDHASAKAAATAEASPPPRCEVLQPANVHSEPTCAKVAPRPLYNLRDVISHLYPVTAFRRATAESSSKTSGSALTVKNAMHEAAEVPRWNVSTHIRYDPLLQSMDVDEKRRSRASTHDDYVTERPGSRPRVRSASARAPYAPPPLTRTALLRLEATAARKAKEAAAREEELHPSFHPEVAPNSARICRQKLRLLATTVPQNAEHTVAETLSTRAALAVQSHSRASSPRAARPQLSRPPSPRRRSQKRDAPLRRGRLAAASATRGYSEAQHLSSTCLQDGSAERSSSSPSFRPAPRARSATPTQEGMRVAQPLSVASPPNSAQRGVTINAPHRKVLEVQLSPAQHTIAEEGLARVDLYTMADAAGEKEYNAEASWEQQRVEERLLALEEDRRRRLYLMRRHADTHDAATGQRLFKPFIGR